MKLKFSLTITLNLKNKIIKKCLQYYIKLFFMKLLKKTFIKRLVT